MVRDSFIAAHIKWSLKVLVLFFLLGIGFLLIRIHNLSNQARVTNIAASPCKPAFADGGGPYYKPNSPMRKKIVPESNAGETLLINGKVMQSDCKSPAANVVVDIWQANESGSYQDEWYRGKIKTDNNGNYEFETVIPKGYGEGTGYRPPHIHFKVFEGNKEIITSQMFFPESKGTPGFEDAYIIKVESKQVNGKTFHTGTHNIILP